MSIDLEERLRRAAQVLDQEAVRGSPARLTAEATDRATGGRMRLGVRLVAASVLVVGLAGTFWAVARDTSGDPANVGTPDGDEADVTSQSTATTDGATTDEAITDGAITDGATTIPPATDGATTDEATTDEATTIPPAATLPQMADVSDVVPPTVLGTEPTDWYRLQPDLDVAWYSDGGGTSMLCFRTPPGHLCELDGLAPSAFGGGPVGVRYVDEQLLVVTLDLEPTVTITFSDGQSATAPVARDPQMGWGVARVAIPDGVSPKGLTDEFDMRVVPATEATSGSAGSLVTDS